MYINCSRVEMNRRATPQQLYSILVGNMNRYSHLQLFGRNYSEKRAYLKKLQNVDFKNYTIPSLCSEMNLKVTLQAPC